jgi:uncharacterized membrane protein
LFRIKVTGMRAKFHKLHPQASLLSEDTWYPCAVESVVQLSGIVLLITWCTLDLRRYAHWRSKQQKDARITETCVCCFVLSRFRYIV